MAALSSIEFTQQENKVAPVGIAYFIICFVLLSGFRVFATLPIENFHQTFSTIAIGFFVIYYLSRMFISAKRKLFSRLDILLWILMAVNFFAAWQSHKVFGQPFVFGLLAQRTVLLCISGVLLISLLEDGIITLQQVEKCFVFLSVAILLTGYFFFLFIDAEQFSGSEFVAFSTIRGYRFRFQFAPVILLLFYSLFKIAKERKLIFSVYVGLILFYLVYFLQSRTTLLAIAITLLVFFLKNFSLRKKVRYTLLISIVVGFVFTVFFILENTALFDKYKVLYGNVVSVFMGEDSDEASAAVRFMEYKTALQLIQQHPLLGNGFVSNQWNGGWQDLLGYFYPVDIGLLGNLFVFGIIGTILLYIPFYYAWKLSKEIRSRNIFYLSCEYMMLFFFITMFFSAANIRDLSTIIIIFCIIYYFRFYSNETT